MHGLVEAFGKPLSIFQCLARPDDSKAGAILVFWDDMKMDVHHLLVCDRAIVLQHVVRTRAGDLSERTADPREDSSDRGR